VFYSLGWIHGLYQTQGPANEVRIGEIFVGLAILGLLKKWAGKYEPGDFKYQGDDGNWHECTGSVGKENQWTANNLPVESR
jgi:hypothetical protein